MGALRPGLRAADRLLAGLPRLLRQPVRPRPRPRGRAQHLRVVLGVPRPRTAVDRSRPAPVAADPAGPRPRPPHPGPAGPPADREPRRHHRRHPLPAPPPARPLGGATRPRRVLRGLDGGLQRHLSATGRGRRPPDQRCRRHRHRTTRRPHPAQQGGHAEDLRRTARRTAPAPLRLRRLRPAGPLRRPPRHHRPGNLPPGRLLRGRHRPAAHATPHRAARQPAGQRRDRQRLPALPRRHRQPARPGRPHQGPAHGPLPLRGHRQGVPHRPQGQLLRRQRHLHHAGDRQRRGGRLPPRHRRHPPAADRRTAADEARHHSHRHRPHPDPRHRRHQPDLRRPGRPHPHRARLRRPAAAGAGGLVLALGLAERRRTFAIATVLGARTRQLRGMVLTEALLLAVAGLAGGALIGWALSEMLVKVLTGVFDPPPATLAVPSGYLALTALAALAAVLTAALNGIRRTRRPAIEELRDL
ncbi:FtsX-like permease family protein [Streptomyces sp. NPDC002586]